MTVDVRKRATLPVRDEPDILKRPRQRMTERVGLPPGLLTHARRCTDAWFDVLTTPSGQRLQSILLAITVDGKGAGPRLKSLARVVVYARVRRKFVKYLRTGQMSPRTLHVVELLGVIGTVARGLVFALAGALVIEAAVKYQPAKAGGLDTALNTLRDQPYGKVALIAAALGLIIFGVYGLCEARWRKV